jgi:hypothetical protein
MSTDGDWKAVHGQGRHAYRRLREKIRFVVMAPKSSSDTHNVCHHRRQFVELHRKKLVFMIKEEPSCISRYNKLTQDESLD